MSITKCLSVRCVCVCGGGGGGGLHEYELLS